MKKDLTGKTLGIVHAALISSEAVKPYIAEFIPEVTVVHHVDDTVQNGNLACEPGTIPKGNYLRFAMYCHFLQEAGVDLVMLACSTFNRAVEYARPLIDMPLLQIDRPMMDLAVQRGRRIGLLATLPTTVPSSERLLRLAAGEAGREVEIDTVLCSEAFEAIKAGDKVRHNALLLEQIEIMGSRNDAIVLAQVSMSALEPDLKNTAVPVINSGRTSFARVREILESLD